MAESNFYKFNDFLLRMAKGEHQLHAAGHTVKVYLTNNAPNAALDSVKADLAGITEENGYAAADIQNDVSESAGVVSVTGVDYEWTFTGPIGPFRYAVLVNSSHANEALIGYYDYGSSLSFGNGEKFRVDFGTSIFTVS
jgi:hypothetical protein